MENRTHNSRQIKILSEAFSPIKDFLNIYRTLYRIKQWILTSISLIVLGAFLLGLTGGIKWAYITALTTLGSILFILLIPVLLWLMIVPINLIVLILNPIMSPLMRVVDGIVGIIIGVSLLAATVIGIIWIGYALGGGIGVLLAIIATLLLLGLFRNR